MPRCDSLKEKRCAQPFSEYSHSYMTENLVYFARQGLIFSYHIHTDCCVLFLLYKSLSMVLQLIEPKPTPMFQEHHLKKLVVASLLIFFSVKSFLFAEADFVFLARMFPFIVYLWVQGLALFRNYTMMNSYYIYYHVFNINFVGAFYEIDFKQNQKLTRFSKKLNSK